MNHLLVDDFDVESAPAPRAMSEELHLRDLSSNYLDKAENIKFPLG